MLPRTKLFHGAWFSQNSFEPIHSIDSTEKKIEFPFEREKNEKFHGRTSVQLSILCILFIDTIGNVKQKRKTSRKK